MKVIFLDIDDCLNSSRTAYAFHGYNNVMQMNIKSEFYNPDSINCFDSVAISMLQRFSKEHNIKFVLSSTWRKNIKYRTLSKILKLDIIDRTLIDRDCGVRGSEIKAWLDSQPKGVIEQYAIIDDDSDMLLEQAANFVKVLPYNGITFQNMQQLANIFEVELIT